MSAGVALIALAWAGWALALAVVWSLRRRMARVGDAEHELRGALTALGLLVEPTPAVALELDRMAAALADLTRARGVESTSPEELEAGRLAQVLGNVIANAAEHGVGPVEVRSVREPSGSLRLELRNRDRGGGAPRGRRGRGVVIAQRAARELGGSVRIERHEEGYTRTIVELPHAGAKGGREAA